MLREPSAARLGYGLSFTDADANDQRITVGEP